MKLNLLSKSIVNQLNRVMGEEGKSVGIDPLAFSFCLLALLLLFVAYLLLPRAFRVHYFHAYPKRHAWAAVPRKNISRKLQTSSSLPVTSNQLEPLARNGMISSTEATESLNQKVQNIRLRNSSSSHVENVTVQSEKNKMTMIQPMTTSATGSVGLDDLSVSAVMQQLREPGLLITAHGSRGKPKLVRLQLVNSAITWRTENRRNNSVMPPKVGKVHSVPLTSIMYIDAGKQTTALRRVENSSIPEHLCFSLLTKEGSLDLEASSPLERDALVSSFSLVLDEIHSQMNWRDGQRGLLGDMPSSFDEYDEENAQS